MTRFAAGIYGASSGRSLGSSDVFIGGTASQFSTNGASVAANAVDNNTGTHAQANGIHTTTWWWQYDFGSGNDIILGAWRQYHNGSESMIDTGDVKASATGSFSGEEVTIASVDFGLDATTGWFQVTWADPGTAYRYWRLYSSTVYSTANGLRPKVLEFEAYAYS